MLGSALEVTLGFSFVAVAVAFTAIDMQPMCGLTRTHIVSSKFSRLLCAPLFIHCAPGNHLSSVSLPLMDGMHAPMLLLATSVEDFGFKCGAAKNIALRIAWMLLSARSASVCSVKKSSPEIIRPTQPLQRWRH